MPILRQSLYRNSSLNYEFFFQYDYILCLIHFKITDINECLRPNNGGCGWERICDNIPGSYRCFSGKLIFLLTSQPSK